MIGHFSADELASYRVGTVSDGKAARISTHLSGCTRCADVHSGLGDVSQLLASVRVPSMPDTFSQRLEAVIAGEAAQRLAQTATSAFGGGRSVTGAPSPARTHGRPDLPERTRRPARRQGIRGWSWSPLLLRGLAAAGVVVLLAGGGILLANERGTSVSHSAAGTTARPVRNRHSSAGVGSAALGSGAVINLRYQHAGQTMYANAVTSEVNYTKADLPAAIRHEVASRAQFARPSVRMPATSAAPGPERRLNHTTAGTLESCLSTVAASRPVLLVEVARYMGAPATIIVFNPVDNAFDVIVVGEACGPGSSDIITTLTVPTK